jgi:hypothetical protein
MKYEKFTTEPDVFAADVELSETSSYNYARYSHLTQEYGLQSPQHQGLARDEFEAAIIDPNVASTTVETPQGNFSFPQLSPLEQNGWLNTKYYEKKYAGPYEKGDVMFYVDLPSITPGEAVKNRLSELADRGGVIVFDYPMTDEDYPKRVDAVLDSSVLRQNLLRCSVIRRITWARRSLSVLMTREGMHLVLMPLTMQPSLMVVMTLREFRMVPHCGIK